MLYRQCSVQINALLNKFASSVDLHPFITTLEVVWIAKLKNAEVLNGAWAFLGPESFNCSFPTG